MINGEKYKTAQERAAAFFNWCGAKTDFSKCKNCVIEKDCDYCPARGMAYWLDLEAEEEKPLPCPFCGGECIKETKCMKGYRVFCERESCGYVSSWKKTIDEAVAAHNRVAKTVKESEVAK